MTYPSIEIVWEDPLPSRSHQPGIWEQRLAPLLERPNTWARVHEASKGTVHGQVSVLKRRKVRIPEGRFEFCARNVDGNTAYIYARYLGPEEPS